MADLTTDSSAMETLGQLFVNGPTWDGNLISKSGRDTLVQLGFAERDNGWQWLTKTGVRAALAVDVRHWSDQRWYNKQKDA